jgi:TPR repeat protein
MAVFPSARSLDPDPSGANIEMEPVHLQSSPQATPPAAQPRARGDGLEKRLIEAAEAGDAGSQCNLGFLYDNGLDDNGYVVEGNRPQAVRWLLAAAEQGLPRAQIKLAEVYAEGPDISGSHATACGWFLLAARGLRGIHLQSARSGYERIAAQLTPAQIAKARRFARDWAPKRREPAPDLGSPGNPDTGAGQ